MCYQVGMNRCRSSADSLDPCPCLGQRQSQPSTGTTGVSHESERHTQACVRNYMTEGKCSVLGIGPRLPEAGSRQSGQASSPQDGARRRGCRRGADSGKRGTRTAGLPSDAQCCSEARAESVFPYVGCPSLLRLIPRTSVEPGRRRDVFS